MPPLLYALSLDPLLRRLASSSRIRGFLLPGRNTVALSAYAHDVSLFFRYFDIFDAAAQLFSEYRTFSGASLNTSKSQALEF